VSGIDRVFTEAPFRTTVTYFLPSNETVQFLSKKSTSDNTFLSYIDLYVGITFLSVTYVSCAF